MMLKMFYYLTVDDTVYVNLFNNTVQRIKDDTTKEEEVDEFVSSILGKYGRIHISNIYLGTGCHIFNSITQIKFTLNWVISTG
jgi:hypothetical protein